MLRYIPVTTKNDPDIPRLLSVYRLPEVARYISIDEQNYFAYVTETPNVSYYKVYREESLVAATHLECFDGTLYMDLVVLPQDQRKGIGTQILKDILRGALPITFDRIEVSIDESNTASRKLFQKMGFSFLSKEEELENYVYIPHTQ